MRLKFAIIEYMNFQQLLNDFWKVWHYPLKYFLILYFFIERHLCITFQVFLGIVFRDNEKIWHIAYFLYISISKCIDHNVQVSVTLDLELKSKVANIQNDNGFVIFPNRWTKLYSWTWILKFCHCKGLTSCHIRLHFAIWAFRWHDLSLLKQLNFKILSSVK